MSTRPSIKILILNWRWARCLLALSLSLHALLKIGEASRLLQTKDQVGRIAVPQFSRGGREAGSGFPWVVALTIDMPDMGARCEGADEDLKNVVSSR